MAMVKHAAIPYLLNKELTADPSSHEILLGGVLRKPKEELHTH